MINLSKLNLEFRNGYKDKERLAKMHDLHCVNCKAQGRKQTTRTIVHHKIGMGLGKKASDLLTMAICNDCHTGEKGIHNMPLWQWEEKNFTQDELIEMTNDLLHGL